ncbi:MAG: hypothetical protein GF331_07180 [Chitinivibrionales bacterium]|nr:hypothetical protein [Chitinivibrionales bacterium]
MTPALDAVELRRRYAEGERDFTGVVLPKKADLSRAELNGVILSGARLRQVDLEDARLDGARLEGADLRDANLEHASLRGANLCGADLRGANLEDVDLTEAILGQPTPGETGGSPPGVTGNASPANLKGADLEEAIFDRASLVGVNLSHTEASDASFVDARLDGACMVDIDLDCARLKRARFGGADLRDASLLMTELQQADLRGVNWRDATLRDAKLQGADLRESDFSAARIDKCIFRGANLAGVDLSAASVSDCDFTDATMDSSAQSHVDDIGARDEAFRNGRIKPLAAQQRTIDQVNARLPRSIPLGAHLYSVLTNTFFVLGLLFVAMASFVYGVIPTPRPSSPTPVLYIYSTPLIFAAFGAVWLAVGLITASRANRLLKHGLLTVSVAQGWSQSAAKGPPSSKGHFGHYQYFDESGTEHTIRVQRRHSSSEPAWLLYDPSDPAIANVLSHDTLPFVPDEQRPGAIACSLGGLPMVKLVLSILFVAVSCAFVGVKHLG